MDVFPVRTAFPLSKLLSFYRREPFYVQAQYADAGHSQPDLGEFVVVLSSAEKGFKLGP